MKLFYGTVFPEVSIDPDEMQHIVKVLRIREGEEIVVTDGKGNLAKGNVVYEGKKIQLSHVQITENLPEFPIQLHVAIAPTKNIDRIEFFMEKAIEMGISEITFLWTENSERKNINLEKLQKQVIGASKQSLRSHFPKLNELQKFSQFIQTIDPESTFVAHCHENLDRISLKEIAQLDQKEYTILIGPEGDFSEREISELVQRGVRAVSLGNQRLRTETAGIFVAAWNYQRMI